MDTCELCAHSGTPPYKSPCHECFDFDKWAEREKTMTNADRIRSMSDEQLASILSPHICVKGACNCRRDWTDELLEWLKQPYKENEE